jgi:hypothetical protein
VDLLKDLAILDNLLVAVDDLVIPDTNIDVAVIEEPVGIVVEPLIVLRGDPPPPPDVEGSMLEDVDGEFPST